MATRSSVESLTYYRPPLRGSWRPFLAAAIVLGALALTGVAVADGLGAFKGISAAQRQQTSADVLPPQMVAKLQRGCTGRGAPTLYMPNCHLVLRSSRLVSRLPSGIKLYVITDTRGHLCVLLPLGMSCGSRLGRSKPITMSSFRASFKTQPIIYGVALDAVTAVTFKVAGREVTVPVKDNVWAYEGASLPEALTAHFSNGTTITLRS